MGLRGDHRVLPDDRCSVVCRGVAQDIRWRLVSVGVGRDPVFRDDDVATGARNAGRSSAGLRATTRRVHEVACPGSAAARTRYGRVLDLERNATPKPLLHSLKHYKVLHEQNVFLTVEFCDVPVVPSARRVVSERLTAECSRITARYGFMEQPDVGHALELCAPEGLQLDPMQATYFLSREKIALATGDRGIVRWRDRIFAAMAWNAGNVTDFFNIPTNRVVELGTRVDI